MDTKSDTITNINNMLDEKKLDQIILNQTIFTSWPDNKSKTYSIRELVKEGDGKISVRQGSQYKFQNRIFHLEDFDFETVQKIEKELVDSLAHLRIYKVKFICYADLPCIKPEHAIEYILLHPDKVKHKISTIEKSEESPKLI